MVRITFARSTMVNFTVLGDVTASWDEDAAILKPQQKLLLARLVYAGGKRVSRPDLMRALSLRGRPELPDGGLRRVAAELRKALKLVMPDEDPVPSGDQGYRLVLEEQQADMFRFRAKRDEALLRTGPEGVTLMRAALKEWGQAEAGLFGRCALRGFPGDWAARTRAELEDEHRRAVIYCLSEQFDAASYREVLVECNGRATDDDQEQMSRAGPQLQVTLLDLDFIELWMRAAHRCGQPTQAEDIGQRALAAAERVDKQADFALKRLVARVTEEETSDEANTKPRASTRKGREAVSESDTTINFYNEGAEIEHQTGKHVGSINYYASPEKAEENSRADDDEAADGE
jgi:hypothetical protein